MNLAPDKTLRLVPPLAMLIAIALIVFAYLPGLRGGFVFDDFANLPALGQTGPIDNWAAFFRYITSGTADPTGRPVALLSFLIDANDWPADPFGFKRTNLIIHVANTALLAWLLTRLGRAGVAIAKDPFASARSAWAAVVAATAWGLHPLFVSTTLYIVQREALLPATFVLLGLHTYLWGRELDTRCSRRGVAVAMVGVALFTLLATLSKANGILLPIFVLVIEHAYLRTQSQSPTSRTFVRGMIAVAWIPAALVVLYLGWVALSHLGQGPVGIRSWTVSQRLLTEPSVVLQYLHLLVMPRPYTPGLYNDDVLAAQSLWHPWWTFPSLIALLAIAATAWAGRRQFPRIALALTFYFAGHLIESTSIPLELYFEHRNYVPALFLFWPLGWWMGAALTSTRTAATRRWLLPVLAMLALVAILWPMTRTNARLWSDDLLQSETWATLSPQSPRAQTAAAQAELSAGQTERATQRLERMVDAWPGEIQVSFNLLAAHCAMGGVAPIDITRAERSMRQARDPGTLIVTWFDRVIPIVTQGQCPGLNLSALKHLTEAGAQNPHFSAGRQQDLLHVRGNIALAEKRPNDALTFFDRALEREVRVDAALGQAALLGQAGYPALGLSHLDTYARLQPLATPPGLGMTWLHAWVLRKQDYWPKELAHLRQSLQAAATAQGPSK